MTVLDNKSDGRHDRRHLSLCSPLQYHW